MTVRVFASAIALIAATAVVAPADAAAVRSGFDASTLAANDDGSTGLVGIGFTADFFGLSFDQVYVNNNGNVTIDGSLSTYTPFDLTSTGRQIIAPFFADVDTRGAGSQPVTFGTQMVDGRDAFGVNWVDVGFFNSKDDPLNAFQLVLIDRSDTGAGNFDIEFNFDRILWEAGEASNGDSSGLGGASARSGFSNGTGDAGTFFELPGSAVNGALLDSGPNTLVGNRRNSNVNGRYVFEARNSTIVVPPPTVPLPAAAPLLLAGLGALVFAKRRRSV